MIARETKRKPTVHHKTIATADNGNTAVVIYDRDYKTK